MSKPTFSPRIAWTALLVAVAVFVTLQMSAIGAGATDFPKIVALDGVATPVKPDGPGQAMGNAGRTAPNSAPQPGDPETPDVPKSAVLPHNAKTLTAPMALQPEGTYGQPLGVDVSGWQQNVNWTAAWNNGARFAYVKASEGPWTLNDYFAQQYNGSAAVGMIRGAYHFARPNLSSGASQARVFVASGGSWTNDGSTLPGVLDLESNGSDSSGACFGMSPTQLVNWTKDFTGTYKMLTGRDATIYTAYYFWQDCMGGSTAFAQVNPLWIAAYGTSANNVWKPGGWATHTIWQYADHGILPGDQNVFNGNFRDLQKLASSSGNEPLTTFQQVASSNPGLGAATAGIFCDLIRGGCIRPFQSGDIYRTPAKSVFTIGDPIRKSFVAQSREKGELGYPISAQICGLVGGGCQQDFEGGSAYIVPGGAVRIVPSAPLAKWRASGAQGGPLGYPLTNQYCGLERKGCQIDFSGGSIYTLPGQLPRTVSDPVRGKWWSTGGHAGNLGYPTSDYRCGLVRGGCQQDFESGSYYTTPSNRLLPITATFRSTWWGLAGQGGPLGYPTTASRCGLVGGGCQQDFENGTIYSTPKGSTIAVSGDYRDKYWQSAGQGGILGYPVSAYRCGLLANGCQQDFEGGSIYSSPATGTQIVPVSTRAQWWQLAGQGGPLGYPKSGLVCGLLGNACVQDFQHGSIYLTPNQGTKATIDPIRSKWWDLKGQGGILGYPKSNELCGLIGNGCLQDFDHGTIYITPSRAVVSVVGKIRSQWWTAGGQGGMLGYPTSDQVCTGSICTQQFVGGTLRSS